MVSPIQNLSIPRVRVRMKATMNSQTLMMKMKRDLTKKAVLVTFLKKFNQGLPDQTHRGNKDTPSDIFGSKDAAFNTEEN